MKLFNLGLRKSGTKSLAKALTDLGIETLHEWKFCSFVVDELERDECVRVRREIDWSGKEAFLDAHFWKVWRKLLEIYPDAVFTMTYRPLEEWIDSCMIHVLTARITQQMNWREINTSELRLDYYRIWEEAQAIQKMGIPLIQLKLGEDDENIRKLQELTGKTFQDGYKWPVENTSETRFDWMKYEFMKRKK